MSWANSELEHVGRIAAVENPDIQYSYALSTVNGMLHLRQAIKELLDDEKYADRRTNLQKKHDEVVRVLQHLIKDYNVDLGTIKAFNTRHVISGFNFLKPGVSMSKSKKNITRRNKKNTTG
jgi:hypothetical protein